MQQQILEDGREQGLHLRFWNEGDPVLQKDAAAPDEIERLGEVNLVVVGAGHIKKRNLEMSTLPKSLERYLIYKFEPQAKPNSVWYFQYFFIYFVICVSCTFVTFKY